MKKIFIASSVHRWNDSRIFDKEAVSLAKKYDVELHVPGDFKHKKINDVNVFCLPVYNKRYLRPLNWFRLFWRALNSRAVVFHFHDPELLLIGLLMKIFTNKRIVYDVHEYVGGSILSRDWIPGYLRPLVSEVFDIFEKAVSNHLDCIITATVAISERFKNTASAVIKNYPSINKKTYALLRQKQENSNNNLIYIGSMNKIRGIHELVKSLKFIDGKFKVKLRLIGSFDNYDFKNMIKNMEEFRNVELIDWLSQEEVHAELLEAGIGVVCFHPTKNQIDSLPRKMFEYMSCGLPVITSNFPLWKEIVEGNNCGLTVNPLNPEEIARAVEYLLSSAELMETMGKNGIKAVQEKYNWDSQENKLFGLYGELLR